MSVETADLVRGVVGARLNTQPRTRHLHLTDAAFHAAVEYAITGLVAAADAMHRRGLGWVVRQVITDAVAELLDDEHLAEAEARSAENRLAVLLGHEPNPW